MVHGDEHGRLDLLGPFCARTRVLVRFDRPKWAVIKRLVSIGLPIGIAVLRRVSSIAAVIALLIGSLGSTVVAGHQIALNISSLLFMIPYSAGHGGDRAGRSGTGAGNPWRGTFRGEGRARRSTGIRGVLGGPDPAPARTYRLDLHA